MKADFVRTIAVLLALSSFTSGAYVVGSGVVKSFEDATTAVVKKIDAAASAADEGDVSPQDVAKKVVKSLLK